MLKKKREFKVLKTGIFSAAFFGFMLSASNVFAEAVAPTTNTPYMNSGTMIGGDGQRGNQVEYVTGLAECRGGTGDNGGSGLDVTVYGNNKALSGYGTGVYTLAKGGSGRCHGASL